MSALLGLLLPLSACNTEQIYHQNPLADEIIRARPGHDGKLTNQTCGLWQGQKCLKENLVEYDLADPTFRSTANQLGFICNLGGRRFKICKDQPGFCRITYKQSCFLFICGKSQELVEYIPALPYKFHLDAGTKCFSQGKYPFSGAQ